MRKRDRHLERIQAHKDRFAKRPAAWLRERLSFGSLPEEAAVAIREVLNERGEPLSAPSPAPVATTTEGPRRVPAEIEDAFYSGQRGSLVTFAINDSVEILSGAQRGQFGAVISIEKLSPDVQLLVELSDDGSDLVVAQSQLRLVK